MTTTIQWAGKEWEIKEGGPIGPGPNRFSKDNVFVDNGELHLRITNDGGVWQCASLKTVERFGYGTYQWWINSDINNLNRNVVLGMFQYPTADVGLDGTHEIDIELIRWGVARDYNYNYGFYPSAPNSQYPGVHSKLMQSFSGVKTTHRYKRTAEKIDFGSFNGHQNTSNNRVSQWSHPNLNGYQSPAAMPAVINLWLFKGVPPSDGLPVEVVFSDFFFDNDLTGKADMILNVMLAMRRSVWNQIKDDAREIRFAKRFLEVLRNAQDTIYIDVDKPSVKWRMFELQIKKQKIDDLLEFMNGYPANQWQVIGIWENDTGLQLGQRFRTRQDGIIDVVGSPDYPVNTAELVTYLPPVVVYDANGNTISSTPRTAAADVHRWLGQQPRNYQ